MKKKVTLDILDIEEPEVVPTKDEPSDAGPPAEEIPLTSPRPWRRSRIFMASGAVFLLLCIAGSLVYFFMGKKKAEQRTPAIAAPATVAAPGAAHTGAGQSTSSEKSTVHGNAPAVPRIAADTKAEDTKAVPRPSVPVSVSLKDFLIPLRRVGKDRPVLSLDVTIQIDSNDQELIKENLAIIRGGVYNALFGIPAEIPKGNKGMDKMRDRIIKELDVSLGPGYVKNVWFPKFVVL